MDFDEGNDYNERCTQCAAVSWGITDEGTYYCTSCLNVTERRKEVESIADFTPNTKIQAINRGLKKKRKLEKGWEWYVCEGFQYILYQQAEALLSLGVCPKLKDEVLHNFWKRYLQKSKQAYCRKPIYSNNNKSAVSDSQMSLSGLDSEPELLSIYSSHFSGSEAESQSDVSSRLIFPNIKTTQSETTSVCSGSINGVEYSKQKEKGILKMTLPMTLAFCYMSLLWQRETITLSDLLRFVEDGHIPYINTYQNFPEEMKVYGRDIRIFSIESWPIYEDIYEKVIELGKFLDLPRFPDITENCFLHPNILCMKYLMEANLPDEMHNLTCQVIKMTGIGEVDFLTFDPITEKTRTVKYDVQAVAVIVVVLKLLFLLNDNVEWSLSSLAQENNENNHEGKPCFEFRKWYQIMKKIIDEKRQQREEFKAKYLWKSEKPLYYSSADRSVVYKRRRMVMNLQKQFSTLVDSAPNPKKKNPTSFQLNWVKEEQNATCFHGHSLQEILQKKGKSLTTLNSQYWLSTQKFCKSYCKHVTTYEESNFSMSYQFILNLFSFLLRIKASLLHEEVSLIEKRLFYKKYENKSKASKSKKARRS
ncbi:TATA box-binding protein-associated factor RNA polymerase I subunit B [Gracilinanus agilis]|uniref:TATA box-binding protein-associated factor RNA polymerase I subunit B n=1 Tax=Gracilinanus agilis TaxID=191870 RepID=UPI001CFE7939|nr:TATA box-binding protein-associated factor RNA polymerase I subunit B [Gracilinanus agilis]